jgi:hypothetical protein
MGFHHPKPSPPFKTRQKRVSSIHKANQTYIEIIEG